MKPLTAISSVIAEATERLSAVSESARLDAELLVARAIDMPRSYLFAHPEDALDEAARGRLETTLARRLAGEPMAYIIGKKEFWSLDLMVSPATLVPRPETELLVELALREIPRRVRWRILDLGTGSGAIAVAIARERPNCNITAIDASPEALAIARQNARQLDLGNVECVVGDWTGPVRAQTFDIIVSNPPYVRAGDPALAALHAEPKAALVAGDDGLAALRILARDCAAVIASGGLLLLEHAADQHADLAAELTACGWHDIQLYKDHAGHARVTTARHSAGQG
jgi:release factor glutamine methyltransferase